MWNKSRLNYEDDNIPVFRSELCISRGNNLGNALYNASSKSSIQECLPEHPLMEQAGGFSNNALEKILYMC